ncbi:CHAT domain-containing protein [Bradyrhizobium diazoefficiens]|nr:CHAT domain-containing protein [Bradyrhizobium diazoefficiens]QQN66761.1 CHAT domain-containing protein [Bradyrhizobium diazoefficiens]
MPEEQEELVPGAVFPEGNGPLPVDDANSADGNVLGDRADLARAFADSFAKNPRIFGGGDILTLEIFDPVERAGILAAALVGLVNESGRRAVRRFVIIVPPGTDTQAANAEAGTAMVAAITLLAGREFSAEEQAALPKLLRPVAAADLRISSVLDLIRQQNERTAVIITEAAAYRDQSIQPYVPPGAESPLLHQDFWVPQFHSLASAATELAREQKLYVALDANELSPSRDELSNLLTSIDRCGVLAGSRDEDPEIFLAQHVGQWDRWIREGRLGRALRDLEHLPRSLTSQKALIRIQLTYRAGHYPQALQAIREEMAPGRKLDATIRVKLARFAQDANASLLAAEVLAPAIAELDRLEEFESALMIAHDIGSSELEDRVADRMTALFVDSPGLRIRHRRVLLAAGDYAGVAKSLAKERGAEARAEYYERLAKYLPVAGVPDYHGMIASAKGELQLAETLRLAGVRDSLRRQLIFHAFELALPAPKTASLLTEWQDLLLEALERLFLLSGPSGSLVLPFERILVALTALIDSLGADPSNQSLRVRLAKLLGPSIAGMTGLALMSAVAMKLASRSVLAEPTITPGTAGADWLSEHEPFLRAALAWLKGEEPIVIGRTVLPKELVTEPADEVLSAITELLSHASLSSRGDASDLQFWLMFAAAVAPHSSDPDFDLRLIRLVSERLVGAGYSQLARDLAEQAVLHATATPRRRRLGWFAMAEVYHRGHNHLEALVALACTFAADSKGDSEQIWQEMVALGRLLRDCGLFSKAKIAIEHAREMIGPLGLSERHRNRLDTLELQTRMKELSVKGSGRADVEHLLTEVVRNGQEVLKVGELAEPVAVMLGQLLRIARTQEMAIPPEAEAIFAKLCDRMTGNTGVLVRTVSADTVSAKDLLEVLKMRDQPRYSEDIGYDLHHVATVAGQALDGDEFIKNAIETSFALELLADRGVAVPGWDEAAAPPPLPGQIEEPAEIARAISRDGLSVVQLGLDARGRLVRMATVNAELQPPVREAETVFNRERFGRWASDYPYAYGIDENTANLFYTTTADLRLSDLPQGPVIVVADASLQPFPPNILYVEDEFAGRTHPIAAAPSLGWLRAARSTGPIGDGRLCAWISTAASQAESQTLSMIAQRLGPSFDSHGFVVDNGPQLPATFAGASVAVIAAHGSIHPEGRYFQLVSDEGVLKVSAADLAGALRNVDVVVLFVCSGGRTDKHPAANTTIGLAKQILDRGCQAVIASPWPLDARVPSHWLPAFLEQWQNGRSLVEANFEANRVVDRNFAQDPARGLAMTVFGNATLRRSNS